MIRRTVANLQINRPLLVDDLLQSIFDYNGHFRRKPNRLELSVDSLNRLLQDKHITFSQDPIKQLQNTLGTEIVIDEAIRDDIARLVYERTDKPILEA